MREEGSPGPCRIQALILGMIGNKWRVENRRMIYILYNLICTSWFWETRKITGPWQQLKKNNRRKIGCISGSLWWEKWNEWEGTSKWRRHCKILISLSLLVSPPIQHPVLLPTLSRCFSNRHQAEVPLFLMSFLLLLLLPLTPVAHTPICVPSSVLLRMGPGQPR